MSVSANGAARVPRRTYQRNTLKDVNEPDYEWKFDWVTLRCRYVRASKHLPQLVRWPHINFRQGAIVPVLYCWVHCRSLAFIICLLSSQDGVIPLKEHFAKLTRANDCCLVYDLCKGPKCSSMYIMFRNVRSRNGHRPCPFSRNCLHILGWSIGL